MLLAKNVIIYFKRVKAQSGSKAVIPLANGGYYSEDPRRLSLDRPMGSYSADKSHPAVYHGRET